MAVSEKTDDYIFADKSNRIISISKNINVIEDGAFCGFKDIEEIVIPEEVKEIGAWAFYECSSLSRIKIHANINFIGENAFLDTAFYRNSENWQDEVLYLNECLIKAKETVNETYFIKDNTRLIAQGAFRGCHMIERIYIPERVEKICDSAFAECKNLKAIYGGINTAAEKYAKENGIKFIAVEYN